MENIEELIPTDLRDFGNMYINAFVTFIDILGFKDIINNNEPEKVNQMLDAIKVFSSLPQRRRPPYNQTKYLPIVTQFSDSIIRIQPVDNFESDEEVEILDLFYEEISSLTIAQGNLVCNGILVRGGMTYGQICVHKNRIFGPAFNRAYYIESKLAKYPRIIIDEFLCSDKEKNILTCESHYNWSTFTEEL